MIDKYKLLLLYVFLFIFFSECKKNKTVFKASFLYIKESNITNNNIIAKYKYYKNTPKIYDTINVLYFSDLSYLYNYKIIDKFYTSNNRTYDTIIRYIKIYNKSDSLLQNIIPHLNITPCYFNDELGVSISRSFITKKNVKYKGYDNYRGEIIIADLNFDGLEDLATPVGTGCDNGPHYAFYIQSVNNKFELNKYLTENMIWFPDYIKDSLFTLTTLVSTNAGNYYQTFKFDTISNKWKKIEEYWIERTCN